jgi:predicted negative regulator of RcsB-dependent stress response
MSTIGYQQWAVDLAQVTSIYPFQGSEIVMTIIGVVFWLGWHKVQFNHENQQMNGASEVENTPSDTS